MDVKAKPHLVRHLELYATANRRDRLQFVGFCQDGHIAKGLGTCSSPVPRYCFTPAPIAT